MPLKLIPKVFKPIVHVLKMFVSELLLPEMFALKLLVLKVEI